jgi:hypothetical protein
MKKKDYIPRGDANFDLWQRNLINKINPMAGQLGIPEAVIAATHAAQARWEAAFKKTQDPATRTKGAVLEKNEAHTAYETNIRGVNNTYLMYNPLLTDEDREDFGLPVHDTKPTPAPPINSWPELEVDFTRIQKHTLTAQDSESKSAGKPAHAAGFEIWRKVGDPAPTTNSDWQLVVQAPHSPHALDYDEAESGLRVYYRARWINTRGVPGPWSETESAIIA